MDTATRREAGAGNNEEAVVISSDSEKDDAGDGENGLEAAVGLRHSELPHCPICLTDILDPKDKAVLQPCFHVFCRQCVHRWLVRHKKLCPLCKGEVRSYIHSIESERRFKEEVLPRSPPRDELRDTRESLGRGSVRPIDDIRLDRHYAELRRRSGARDQHRHLLTRPTGHGGRLRAPPAADHEWPPRRPQSRRARSPSASSSAPARPEPRPYYWRVQRTCQRIPGLPMQQQQQQQIPGQLPSSSSDAGPSRAQQAMLWRRRVYSEDLWVAGLERRASSRFQDNNTTVRQQRLREWLMRELKAVLRNDDVSFLVMYFLGLLGSGADSAGRRRPCSALAEHLERWGRSTTDTAAAEVLPSVIPFLGAHSRHFWHEFRCFALSGMSVPAFDDLASYVHGEVDAKRAERDAEGVVGEVHSPIEARREDRQEGTSGGGAQEPLPAPPESAQLCEALSSEPPQQQVASRPEAPHVPSEAETAARRAVQEAFRLIREKRSRSDCPSGIRGINDGIDDESRTKRLRRMDNRQRVAERAAQNPQQSGEDARRWYHARSEKGGVRQEPDRWEMM